jgi:hypothetical protein
MNFINIYLNVIKNNKNYNIIFYNKKSKILMMLNIKYNLYLKLNNILYTKLLKSYFIENGLKILLIEN